MPRILTPCTPIGEQENFDWFEAWMQQAGLSAIVNSSHNFWDCGNCQCMYLCEIQDLGMRTHLHKYTYSGETCEHCYCHTLPASIPIGAGTVSWLSDGDLEMQRWGCSTPQNHPHTCVQCRENGVVFLNLPHENNKLGGYRGPEWRCAEHAGVEVPPKYHAFNAPLEEPAEFQEARIALECMLTLT